MLKSLLKLSHKYHYRRMWAAESAYYYHAKKTNCRADQLSIEQNGATVHMEWPAHCNTKSMTRTGADRIL